MSLLVREALALRQKVVVTRQQLFFLKRCRATETLPRFVANKKLGSTCCLPEDHPKIRALYMKILNVVIKEKQHMFYSNLLKCRAKEDSCRRYMDDKEWKRIESASKRICDTLRSNTKSTLCKKFEGLLSEGKESSVVARGVSPALDRSSRADDQNDKAIERTARVTVLGNAQISSNAIEFLSLGPSFAPSQNIDARIYRNVLGSLQRLRDQLRVKLKRDNQAQPCDALSRRSLPIVPFPSSFYKEPEPCIAADTKFRILSLSILNVLNNNKGIKRFNLTQAQQRGFKEIRELTNNGAIRLSISDKGGEFVVMSQTLDREITEKHLSDNTVYQPATEREFLSQCKRLNHIWTMVGKEAGLPERFLSRLKLETPTCPVFYSLIKTHKLSPFDMQSVTATSYKIRPIISCINGPTDRISWFLNKIVNQLLNKIPAHLTNTNHFLELLRKTNFSQDCVIESFDVTSLYTNVSNEDALQALSEMLELHSKTMTMYTLSKARVMTLIRECLRCNIFKWSGQYYAQVRGLAMGQRLAPVLAICFMSRIEQPVLSRSPLMYCRYIDDCCIVTSTQSEMDKCFEILNQQSKYISFTREKPCNGWLPFLNTQLMVANGTVQIKWYRKESSKNILLHAQSAHPTAVKRAIIRNMVKTALNICSGENERQESLRMAAEIATANGYTMRSRRTKKASAKASEQNINKIPLCLPYISEKVSTAIRQCLMRAQLENDVVLVNIPRDNIKSQLVRNRIYDTACIMRNCVVCPFGKTGDCSKSGVVYQIECLACSAIYIGETGRPLYVRANEHLASKKRQNVMSPLGKHRKIDHSGNDFDIKCKILAYENHISARKALEASYILVRDPKINNKNEQLS